jgi:peptidoglycan/LPS O-acetylase OafA/YrhL
VRARADLNQGRVTAGDGLNQTQTANTRFVFLDYLRAMAAWAVVWDHILAGWSSEHGAEPRFVAAIDTYVMVPLGIIQHGGWLAVCLFFLISGFVITHVAAREGVAEFLVKRFFRIFPLLAIFVLLSIGLQPALWGSVSWASLLRNMTLVNWFHTPQVNYVGVAWTLVIEVQFYVLVALTMAARRPLLALAANLAVPIATTALCRQYDANFFLFSASMAFVPYLVVGQVFYLGLYRRSLGLAGMAVSLAACFGVILYGIESIHTVFLPASNSYLISFAYACVLFVLFFHFNARLRSGPILRFLAASSFAVYLVHGVIGWAAFNAVWPRLGGNAGVVAALVTTLAGAAAIHLWVERPLLAAGHRVARWVRPKTAPDAGLVGG